MTQILEKYFDPLRKMFLEYGIKKISMDNISRRLCISKKTLYKEYANKQELIRDVFLCDLYRFKSEISSVTKESKDAVEESIRLFTLFETVRNAFSLLTLSDFKEYYHSLFIELSQLTATLISDAVIKVIKRGIVEENFNPDIAHAKIAGFITFVFESYFFYPFYEFSKESELFFERDVMDYYLKSICTPKGLKIWDAIQMGKQATIRAT